VKDLIFTLLDLSTLSQVIAQVVRCDNRFFEDRQKRCHEPTSTTQEFCTISNTKELSTYNANLTLGNLAKG
jgi:hypothetical protein